jgi:hypothetical protein
MATDRSKSSSYRSHERPNAERERSQMLGWVVDRFARGNVEMIAAEYFLERVA